MQDFWLRHGKNCKCGCNYNSFLTIEPDSKKSVSIIGGFLGAGKTTTVNHLLSVPINRRIEVVVREFGSIAVDDKFIREHRDRVHAFTGASLHVDPQTMLTGYIENLYAAQDNHPFDNLLIEASGRESAEQIAQIFYLPRSRDHYELASFITIVDAEFGLETLCEFRVANEQAALADYIIVNKVDCAVSEKFAKLEKVLRHINPFAEIIETSFGAVDAHVLKTDNYAQLRAVREDNDEAMKDVFNSIAVRIREPLDRAKVDAWLRDTYARYGDKLLRGKGYFNIAGSDYRFDFQSVRKNFHAVTEDKWESPEARESVVVFIGAELPDREEIRSSLVACIFDIRKERSA